MKSSQKTIKRELEVIQDSLKQFEEGASLDSLKKATGLEIEPRTLQRRLDKLQELGIVITSGKTRGTLYHFVQTPAESIVEEEREQYEDLVPLSKEGKEIRKLIRLPIARRRPVGYNATFLRSYRPNIDSYLTSDEKRKLRELGKTTRLDHPAGTYAKEILQRLLIDLSWNSSRLEGNTYSLLDTQRLIAQGKAADNKTAAEAQMILNHKDAIEFLVQAADEIEFNRYTITNLHALLSDNLLPEPASSGRLRTFGVGITSSVFTPLGIPQQINELFELILEKTREIKDPFEQAFFIMVQIPYLQPFDDVNKRTSRLAANIPLNAHNLAPLAFLDVPNDLYVQGLLGVYELNRIELYKDVFMWAYERSAQRYATIRQTLGEPNPFRSKYREEIRELITEIISSAMQQKEAIAVIQHKAVTLPEKDQQKFTEAVDTELLSLHDGNFARYWVRPSEFKRWKDVWGDNNL